MYATTDVKLEHRNNIDGAANSIIVSFVIYLHFCEVRLNEDFNYDALWHKQKAMTTL